MDDLDPTRPKWPQIAETLAERITGERWKPGRKITVPEIMAEFGVSKVTAGKVTAELRARKLVRTEFGMGSYVTDLESRGEQ
ncbi:GntR family transcriptional regulator [Kitasatospora sp. NPDC088346]|uniref:GntR family transcriptional regulator n=1 Tax=Kitasatospora sp. NPDC088346 TaxID=3364073 RepID=UPI003823AA28